jgi:hypothetical protein
MIASREMFGDSEESIRYRIDPPHPTQSPVTNREFEDRRRRVDRLLRQLEDKRDLPRRCHQDPNWKLVSEEN